MTDGSNGGVVVEAAEGVLRLTIDRPDRKGSLGLEGQRQMIEALEAASTDDALRVVLISSGDDFCAGSDWVAANQEGAPKPRPGSLQRRTVVQAHRLIELLQEIQLPVVAAVRGWAAGLGCQIALASDFAIATDDAQFWLPFVKRGFSPDSGATWLLPRLVGVARAKELLLLGRPVTGRDAADWGMIHRSVPDDAFDEAVAALVGELHDSATVALGLTKRLLHGALDGGMAEAMEAESMALELSSRTADFREGLVAFKERRDPRFDGR
ncbi:enoyl-CoA hydratase/isomerase family protein [Aquihabitans sp. McL0605]|uniref:enoyl-CoA hydratase/isomerase family protein n=1 Tax=Aquihabitans sp. McL0605 TaxID=3415671 RepID=UPI003CE9E46B